MIFFFFETGSHISQAASNSCVAETGHPPASTFSAQELHAQFVVLEVESRILCILLKHPINCPTPQPSALVLNNLIMCLGVSHFTILVIIIHQTWICVFIVFINYVICIYEFFFSLNMNILFHPLLLEFQVTPILGHLMFSHNSLIF